MSNIEVDLADSIVTTQDFKYSVMLRMPKFSKGFVPKDILESMQGFIPPKDVRFINRMHYPNMWAVTFRNTESREKFLRAEFITVKGKKGVITPYSPREVRGRIHWVPVDFDDSVIMNILKRFGDVVVFECISTSDKNDNLGNVRIFSLLLNEGTNMDDIPHFLSLEKRTYLVTVLGRKPICLGCKKPGHKKFQCDQNKFKREVKIVQRHIKAKFKKFIESKPETLQKFAALKKSSEKNEKQIRTPAALKHALANKKSINGKANFETAVYDNISNIVDDVVSKYITARLNACSLTNKNEEKTKKAKKNELPVAASTQNAENSTQNKKKKNRKKKKKASNATEEGTDPSVASKSNAAEGGANPPVANKAKAAEGGTNPPVANKTNAIEKGTNPPVANKPTSTNAEVPVLETKISGTTINNQNNIEDKKNANIVSSSASNCNKKRRRKKKTATVNS